MGVSAWNMHAHVVVQVDLMPKCAFLIVVKHVTVLWCVLSENVRACIMHSCQFKP